MNEQKRKIWGNYNARMGYDGRSKWTLADWQSYYGGESKASKRSSKVPKYTDEVPF
jgi:hypothetical protein